ncbi:MAG: response regulator [Acidobacteria bacterium]|nr:MAG: response regulator [Acidobacteriota bacterium]
MSVRPVLVVDDDPEIREMTALLLSGGGHAVETAGSGEEALALARAVGPAVILLDINMPGMDGWEVLRLLKEDPATASIPVIMFSIRFELREKLHALQKGAADYVTKPFDVEGLLERIARFVGAGSGERR